MDHRNLFQTPTTFLVIRLEYLAGFIAMVVLAIVHWDSINLPLFVLLFAYIDLIGYVPGAIVTRVRRTGYIPRRYYILYNLMHTLFTQALLAGLWLLFRGPDWTLLALPIHLFVDRSVNGNFLKSYGVSFEPEEHPDYFAVKPLLDHPRRPTAVGAEGSHETTPTQVGPSSILVEPERVAG